MASEDPVAREMAELEKEQQIRWHITEAGAGPAEAEEKGEAASEAEVAKLRQELTEHRQELALLRRRTNHYVDNHPTASPFASSNAEREGAAGKQDASMLPPSSSSSGVGQLERKESLVPTSIATSPVPSPDGSGQDPASVVITGTLTGYSGPIAKSLVGERIFYCGWVDKEGGRIKTWKRRFFILYRNRIEYFVKPTEQSSFKGSIDLDDSCHVMPFKARSGVKLPSIEILFKTRKWHITAGTDEENTAWFRAIHTRIITLSYQRRCDKSRQLADPRVLAFLDELRIKPDTSSASSGSESSSAAPPAPLALVLNGRPLSLETVSVVASLLSDQYLDPIQSLECVRAGLSAIEIELLLTAAARNPRPSLTSVNFSENAISAPSLDGLVAIGKLLCSALPLEQLILADCKLDDGSIEVLARTVSTQPQMVTGSLRCLELGHNDITCKGVDTLLKLLTRGTQVAPNLIFLSLNENRVGSRGAEVLASWASSSRTLSHLLLRDNLITDAGAIALAKLIRRTQVLQTLDVSLNDKITHAGAASLTRSAQVNESLEYLAFTEFQLDKQGLMVLRLLNRYGLDRDHPEDPAAQPPHTAVI